MSTHHFVASDPTRSERGAFADEVERALTQRPRQLPSRYLYDALGSALFSAICELPWYGIARTERALLEEYAGEIAALAGPPRSLVELGPGNGEKLGILLDVTEMAGRDVTVHLIDISAAALAAATRTLASRPGVALRLHEADYETGLDQAARSANGRTMTLCLGSNIGNYDPPGALSLLERIRATLAPGDLVLIGMDLVKSPAELQLAYDDPLGITAAFNRNLLVRINRELGGDFDVAAFHHRAVWNAEASRMEMHLVCDRAQSVRLRALPLDISLGEGETIWTESSYKYRPEDIRWLLNGAGLTTVRQWIRDGYALTLAEAVARS
jgi:dimethylhistidine N-methyltransferase